MSQPTKKGSALPEATSHGVSDILLAVIGGITKSIRPSNINSGKVGGKTALELSPIASMIPYAGIAEPSGWFFAIGTAKSRTTYADLYNALTADKGTFTVTQATPAVFTLNAHGLATGNCVELTTTGALYTGLSVNTNYFVIYINANTFNLATSLANALAGTKIATSGTQSGTHSLRYCPWGISGASNFLLPDAREGSVYGIGTRGTEVTAHDVAVLGQFKDDQAQGHAHGDGTNNIKDLAGFGSGSAEACRLTNGTALSVMTDGPNGTPRIGTVTRGKIIGVNYIIKY